LIAGLVLAAGASRRMGSQKLLLPVDGEALVRRATRQVLAAGLDEVVVVLGREADAVGAALAGLPVRTVVNPRFAEGQATSLRVGLAAVGPAAEAVVVALGDQPLEDPGIIGRLVEVFRAGAAIAMPRYRDGRGHPVLFAARVFPELAEVEGDQGGRGVVARDPARVREVPADGPVPPDVDTWADYQALAARLKKPEAPGRAP
jgi:molybdenum cofactor cytidylyltransferase